MPDLSDFEKFPQKPQTCPAVGSQSVVACLPVTVCPYAVTGPAVVQCCGEPIVNQCCGHCRGKVNGTCEFTISQKIRVEIPVEFGASVNIGDTFVDCDCPKCDDFGCEFDGKRDKDD